MSTLPAPHPTAGGDHGTSEDFTGVQVLFAMAAAFLVVLATIILAAFMPIAVGVTLVFVVLAVVLAIVGGFLAHLLGDG
jgi:Flp pilus assembly protein TadB